MKFVIAIEPGSENTAFGVVVPDLTGCFSAGDTMEEAMDNARDAIELWCETAIEAGRDIPVLKSITVHQARPEFAGWIWAVIEAPVERYFGPATKLNITLPKLLLAKIDTYAASQGLSRSGFLADAARKAMR
jgi:predicted RNase H-like HicB family nuclease